MDCQPDIVVAIDLGTTYTGAGWTSRRTPVHIIDQWPGSGGLVEQKVPTVLIHNANNTVSSWGFNCEDDEDSHGSKRRRELFKIFLDHATLEEAQRKGVSNLPSSTAEAEGFVSDYLKQVYACVKDKIESEMGLSPYGSWGHLAVEFLFSVPTTWTNQGIVNSFNRIIYDAGFGREGPRHKALVDLTEAQAAAVATLLYSTINFQAGTVFLTVDGGGGTTDLALMQVTSTDEAFPKLAQLCAVCGVGVGATLIDQAFANLVARRLSVCPDVMQLLPLDYPARFARSHAFKQVKHKFGEQAVMLLPSGKMVFSRQEIQSLFDQQIVGIMNKIVEQLDWLKANHPSQQVHYMILSGGLEAPHTFASNYNKDSCPSRTPTLLK
ncbi:unnamed protein product [Parascedosporium putredinis]|uniref:Uncharacterized protein n=1 Tax=Parascedosporium putredinis TaxID=1442378 RepID=A0A9P1H9T5_9PEZI|nr:unnamed protein product [Parascedosporium putredinis]CAI8003351.1 unnamed protein product [Parascedosporium putredinis]